VAVYGDDHPSTADALNNVAASLAQLPDGRAQAHALLRAVLRLRRADENEAAVAGALENVAMTAGTEDETITHLNEAYLTRVLAQGPDHPAAQRCLRLLLGTIRRGPDPTTNGDAPIAEVAEALPDWLDSAEIRLDHERTDELIDLHQLALEVWEARLAAAGPDDPDTMLAVCYLAHAHAALNQFDRQVDDAWVLINDSLEGLAQELGSEAYPTRVAQRLHDWIAGIGDLED
jgi:hypothetical protein